MLRPIDEMDVSLLRLRACSALIYINDRFAYEHGEKACSYFAVQRDAIAQSGHSILHCECTLFGE
jgi:hypothetical protein